MAASATPKEEKMAKPTKEVEPPVKPSAEAPAKEEPAAGPSAPVETTKETAKEEAEGTDAEAPLPVIEMDTFSQILEMDDDDTHEFSLSIVENYMEQARTTFESMGTALKDENLSELSRLGHFLKGSSAALGISQVQTGCEAMQYYGQLKKGPNGTKLAPKEALDLIRPLLEKIKEGHTEADKWLRDFYGVDAWSVPEE